MTSRNKGFTLMESLAVIFIMAVLAGIMLPALRRVREEGRVTHARNEINQLIAAAQMYAEDWGTFPADDGTAGAWQDGYVAGQPVSRSLIEALQGGGYTLWPGILIGAEGLFDPWGNPYRYRFDYAVEGRAAGVAFNLYSAGPDGIYGTEHDITNW